jgi:hypothetical protein
MKDSAFLASIITVVWPGAGPKAQVMNDLSTGAWVIEEGGLQSWVDVKELLHWTQSAVDSGARVIIDDIALAPPEVLAVIGRIDEGWSCIRNKSLLV